MIKRNNIMKNLNKIKILIVGLTTVLALSSFNNTNFRKGKVYTQITNLKITIPKVIIIQIIRLKLIVDVLGLPT